MATSPSSLRVGLFVILGVAALLTGIFLVGSQEGLFRATYHVSAYFSSVEGVRSGSIVRLAGVDIGVVDEVEVSPRDNKVRLGLKLNSPSRSFVKKDSYATITPEGLVGNYYVDVTVGSRTGGPIEDGDVIQTTEAVRLSAALENAGAVLENVRRASDELTKTFAAINGGQGTLGKLIVKEDIYKHLEHISGEADTGVSQALGNVDTLAVSVQKVVRRTDSLVANVNAMFTRLNEGGGTVGALLSERSMYDSLLLAVGNTVRATEKANIGAGRFAEDMEALKHNFLLRGYFEDRGYWDEADYEKRIDRKLDSLKTLEAMVASQVQAIEARNAQVPK
jgi:phospholipid/cholesterol/gamma-HCH transport system substrate-binding protein